MKKMILLGVLASVLFAPRSLAGVEEVKACEASLPNQAQLILRAVAPRLKPGVDAREVIKSTVISMVRSGEIDSLDARRNARAAIRCLEKLNS